MKKIFFITSREEKFLEAKVVVPNLERKEFDLLEIQELDAKKVVEEKLGAAKKMINGNILIEDVSFEIDAFNKFPGPLIKWFLKSLGNSKMYSIAKRQGNLNARFICTVGLYYKKRTFFFEGIVEGKLTSPRGSSGFGIDPIFIPKGHKKTFAEMTYEEKSKISHRGKAFKKVSLFLTQNP